MARSGCVRSRMVRSPKRPAATLWLWTVAAPSSLPASCRKLKVPLGCAPSFPAGRQRLLTILPKPPPERANPLSRLSFSCVTKKHTKYDMYTGSFHASLWKYPVTYCKFYLACGKNSRRKGGGAGLRSRWKNVRSPWHPVGKAGAQPSGTCSFRRVAGSGQGGATGHSHSVAAGCLGLLTFWKRLRSPAPPPFLQRPPHILKKIHNSIHPG